MLQRYELRHSTTMFAVILLSSCSAKAAYAACGMAAVTGGASGPPSISTTETSTTQVLEQVRKRTQAAQEPQPIEVSNTAPAATAPPPAAPPAQATTTQSSTAAATSTAAASASAPSAPKVAVKKAVPAAAPQLVKPAATVQATSPPPVAKAPVVNADAKAKPEAVEAKVVTKAPQKSQVAQVSEPEYASLKDYGTVERRMDYAGSSRSNAVWAQGFLGYDRHKNLAPGNKENPTRRAVTGGGVIGTDWTHVKRGDKIEAVQFGLFSGYSATRANLSDTFFETIDSDNANTNYFRSQNKEEIDGPFIGSYLAYIQDKWTFDFTFKADFFDLEQSSALNQRCGNDIGTQNGSASVNNYMFAVNAAHRYDIGENRWFEPTAGMRYTITEFGKDPSFSVFQNGGVQTAGRLGLEDGSALRLQFGARLGERVEMSNGHVLTTTVGAFLYSDVLISGFETVAGQTGEAVGPVDEGKLRVMGQLETKLDVGNGLSYLLQAEIRGGDDVFGAAGQLGIRYNW